MRNIWNTNMEKDLAWPTTLVGWMREMFQVEMVWKPKYDGEEPPF